MSQHMRRSFHGCLTCRRRKVRCGGGNPCQNCSRMNVACHAPFDANWKVSVGVLEEDRNSAGSVKSRKTGQSTTRPKQELSTRRDEAARPSNTSETSTPGTNCDQNAKTPSSDLPFLPAEAPVFQGQLPESSQVASVDGLYSDQQLPWNSTWDFDFSLDPWFDCAATLPDAPAWSFDSPRSLNETPAGTSGPSISSTSSRHHPPTEGAVWRSGCDDMDAVRQPTHAAKRKLRSDMQQTGRQGDDGSAFFFQHYEHSISGWAYSLKDDGKGNYLRFVLDFIRDPRCPPDSAFRLAVLAWTAKHWAVTCQPGDTTWRSFYDRAMATMQRLEEQDSDGSPDLSTSGHQVMASASEVIICSTLFLCRCDVLNDDLNSILNHLEALKLRLDAHLSGPPLSAFASQILLWLGYLHVRVSIFAPSPVANTPQDGSVATTLLDVIASHPTYEQIVNRSQTYLVEIFGESYPPEELLQDAEKAPVAVRTHETFCLIANMLRYRSWKRLATQKGVSSDQLELEKAKVEAIDVDIRRMDVEFGLAMATNPSAAVIRRICFQSAPAPPLSTFSMTNTQFVSSPGSTGVSPVSQSMLQHGSSDESLNRASSQWLACYAVFLTAKILWSRFLHPTARSDSSAATAVKSILSIALHLRRAHEASSPSTSWPHKIPRSMLWPLPLFIAGVETTDEVHADWIRGFMNEVTSSWGGEVAMSAKTRDLHKPVGQRDGCDTNGPNRVQILMGRVRRLQDQLGCRVDIESVVRDMSDESGRGFIL